MMEIEHETVYGTHEDSHVVMSEKVQSLAGSIYQEFEKMISKYDEDVVKDLMPLVVNVLECLDLSYTENQEHEVELELLREDNEQLVTQYEREKQLRKAVEQKLLEVEDANEGERKDLTEKNESLESIVRMLELKAKNSSDHVYRLEEKEQEQKREYAKLHERYTELFKTHMDYMERTKILMGSAERLEGASRRIPNINIPQMNRSSGPVSFGFASLEGGPRSVTSPADYIGPITPPDSNNSNTSLRNELQEMQVGTEPVEDNLSKPETSDKGQLTDAVTLEHRGTVTRGGWVDGLSPSTKDSTPELEDVENLTSTIVSPIGRSKTKKEQRSGNTLYQELSFQDAEALSEMDEGADITGSWVHPGEYASSVNDNFFGMGKEVENLIMENNELLATKNALNIVKDDLIVKVDELTSEQEILREEIKSLHTLKNRLHDKIQDLEEELKRVKEEAEKATKAAKSDDEEDVPMAQRKRFTRVEMARVLMERNQYKERFMELQEAVRWTEMIRASRNDPTGLDKKSKQSIWKFFSNLFSTPERPPRKPMGHVNVHYNAPTHHVSPALETMRKRSQNDRKRTIDYMEGEISSEKLQQRRATERREQYRQVRAHVRRDDGRLQAYGWSLPAKVSGSQPPNTPARSSSQVPVPVPVYCRPLAEKEPGMKVNMQIWCAAGVNLSGGRTRDGGSIVGASVFYTRPDGEEKGEGEQPEKCVNEIDKLDQELKEGEKIRREGEELEQQLSSLVWICTSTHTVSKVTVIDANNPADILEAFNVCTSHVLCIASVPGATESDYLLNEEPNNKETCEQNEQENISKNDEECCENEEAEEETEECETEPNIGRISFVSCATGSEAPETNKVEMEIESEDSTPTLRLVKEVTGVVKDGLSEVTKDNEAVYEEVDRMSSVLPTMWLGSQNGYVYVHSAVAQWRRCLHSVKLKDSVLSIVHIQGRVLVALADGSVAVFRRGVDGEWDLGSYHLVDLGSPQHSIRCMAAVHGRVWCGYRNKIHVLHPRTLIIEKSFDAHPRKESQVRQMSWLGDGVWVSIRLDSTLRLYHAHTYQHLQDVDIEPYVSKMLGTGKLGFSFVRITALLISSCRLWIGTGNGVVISVPLSENAGGRSSGPSIHRGVPGGVIRVYSDNNSKVTPGSFIPYCSMAQAQLSFHGHRDAVKFFVAVPGSGGFSAASEPPQIIENIERDTLEKKKPAAMLVMSGGEGYIDFRIGDGEEEESGAERSSENPSQQLAEKERGEHSHLIVWQVIVQD